MPKAEPREGICETQPSPYQGAGEAGPGSVGFTQDTVATGSPGRVTVFPPTHRGPNSLAQAMGHGQHPLGSDKDTSTDV